MNVLVVDDKQENMMNGMRAGIDAMDIEDEPSKPYDGTSIAGRLSAGKGIIGVTNTKDAKDSLRSYAGVDLVVCDIQMPCHGDDGRQMTSEDTPGGVSIALEALADGIPVVFCSSEYHHGDALEWLNRSYYYLEEMSGVPVKLVTGSDESGGKRWGQAFELALEIAESER
jgi:CheY-like chemotaxis protein